MKIFFSILLLFPLICFSQLENAPLKDGKLTYEKVIVLDSVNDRNLVYNAAKSALVRNTNYKYTKVDEDRTSGNITTEINFIVVVPTSLGRMTYNAKSNLSIDVKENRFRIRLFNNTASFVLMQQLIVMQLDNVYLAQKELIANGKYKPKRDNFTSWNNKLNEILDAFVYLVKEGVKDEF